jgi:hypothetical protein
VMHMIETSSADLLTFDCYRLAIRRLLNEQSQAPRMSILIDWYLRFLRGGKGQEQLTCNTAKVANFFLDILQRASPSDEPLVQDLLLQFVEQLLLVQPNADTAAAATAVPTSIPSDFFHKVFNALERHRMLNSMEKLFRRLKEYSESGRPDLGPDSVMYSIYAQLLLKIHGVDSLDQRLDLLTELYKSSHQAAESKPIYDIIGGIVAGLQLRCKAHVKKGSYEQYEQDTQTALSLIDTVHRFRIVPENLDRVFAFNVTMELILGSPKKDRQYPGVMEVKRKMLDLGLQPNKMTHTAVIRAAAYATNGGRLNVTLDSLVALRQHDQADAPVYMSCFRTLLMSQDQQGRAPPAQLEKIAASVFQCCCDDGAFTSYAKSAFLRLCSKDTVDKIYTKRLDVNSKEPASWTRKAHGFL